MIKCEVFQVGEYPEITDSCTPVRLYSTERNNHKFTSSTGFTISVSESERIKGISSSSNGYGSAYAPYAAPENALAGVLTGNLNNLLRAVDEHNKHFGYTTDLLEF